jgi:nitroreductase
METTDLVTLIQNRRSIRLWQDKPVPEEQLLKALELATYAPNAGNQQNWFFYLILNKNTILSVADAVQESANYVAALPEASGFDETALRMIKGAAFFRNAPAGIAVACSHYQSPVDRLLSAREKSDPADTRTAQIRQWRSISNARIQSAASAIGYLLLILHQMGFGAVWMTGPLQAKGAIEKILKVPAERDLIAYIPVGYPAETPALKIRKPVREVCEIIK